MMAASTYPFCSYIHFLVDVCYCLVVSGELVNLNVVCLEVLHDAALEANHLLLRNSVGF